MNKSEEAETLIEARDDFVTQWGAIGNAWGINRTMAQIHALLLVSPGPLSTDEIMEDLHISRGNANTNLRDLVGWGLIKSVIRKGERKEFFEAEKDVWKMFCTIARERKRREISPAIEVLQRCSEKTTKLKADEAVEFHRQMEELGDFLRLADRVMEGLAGMEENKVVSMARKFFGTKV
ncbi:MAG: transcriptional regulator [Verrucomicrobiota bacterium]